jgi:predicted DCC family thiol-disulfide oxidoreductase YuxK
MTELITATQPKDILYYDGQCPLCRREMSKLAALKDDKLELKDIHTLTSNEIALDKDTLLRVLHLNRNGEYLTGIDANIAAWEHTRYGALWRWMRLPLIRVVIEWFYARWALVRYNKLYK